MRQKSPCVQDCPDRLPCWVCRKDCESFQIYEKERLKDRVWDDQSNTYARERLLRENYNRVKAGKSHMR